MPNQVQRARSDALNAQCSVLSRLKYSSPFWNPMHLESVQPSFTAKIEVVETKDYWECLQTLKLYSLQHRRQLFTIIHLFKVYKKLSPSDLKFKFTEHIRLGPQYKCCCYPNTSASLKKLHHHSFSCIAARLGT